MHASFQLASFQLDSFQLDSIQLETNFWESALRLALALLCGLVIGWDRESRDQDAGLRTHMLVSLGSAGFTLVSIEAFEAIARIDADAAGHAIRILSAIVGGVGFLGAGVIFHHGGSVQGITTAAGIWVMAAVGVSAGAGYYSNALLITGFAWRTLHVLRRLKGRVRHRTADD